MAIFYNFFTNEKRVNGASRKQTKTAPVKLTMTGWRFGVYWLLMGHTTGAPAKNGRKRTKPPKAGVLALHLAHGDCKIRYSVRARQPHLDVPNLFRHCRCRGIARPPATGLFAKPRHCESDGCSTINLRARRNAKLTAWLGLASAVFSQRIARSLSPDYGRNHRPMRKWKMPDHRHERS
jgi:hypothetical protein